MLRNTQLPVASFWRSDTRKSESGFQGFTSRDTNQDPADWWQSAIKIMLHQNYAHSVEGDSRKAICMSSYFFSAPMFPKYSSKQTSQLPITHTTIYSIAMPQTLKLQKNLQLDENQLIPIDHSQVVVDLHSYQTAFTSTQLAAHPEQKSLNMMSINTLYGYEALALEVPKENIMFAINIERDPQHMINYGLSNTSYISFRLRGAVQANPNFKLKQKLLVKEGEKVVEMEADYSELYESELAFVNQLLTENKTFVSTQPEMGLGGKTFTAPITERRVEDIFPPVRYSK